MNDYEIDDIKEGFAVDTDIKAEWCIKTIKEHQAETKRLVDVCKYEIMQYTQKIENYDFILETSTGNLKEMLFTYFETVEHKKSKTGIESYELPSGKLKLGNPTNEFVRDKEALVKFLQDNDFNSYVKIIQEPKWGEFKKLVTVHGDKVFTDYGQVVDGVTVIERPAEFEVVL